MRKGRSRGFSLIEAIASVLLIAIGIVVLVDGLNAFGRSQTRALDAEKMQLLALRKYDEIAAMGALPSGQASGDFADAGEPDFKWTAERATTGTGNLDTVQIDIERKSSQLSQPYEIQGLICRPVPPKDSSQ
jgi:Tfp pilus assembly protein PilV